VPRIPVIDRGKPFMTRAKPAPITPTRKLVLDTLSGIMKEQQRLYRLAVNARIPPEDLSKYGFALRELRCTLEADMEQRAAANARLYDAGPMIDYRPDLPLLVVVPSGTFLSAADAAKFTTMDPDAGDGRVIGLSLDEVDHLIVEPADLNEALALAADRKPTANVELDLTPNRDTAIVAFVPRPKRFDNDGGPPVA
jgi:hypothetical protein